MAIDVRVLALIDSIYLPQIERSTWQVQVVAMSKKANTSLAADRWIHWQMSELSAQSEHCAAVRDLYARRLGGDEPTREEWGAVSSAAMAAWDSKSVSVAFAARSACVASAAESDGYALTRGLCLCAMAVRNMHEYTECARCQADALSRVLKESLPELDF